MRFALWGRVKLLNNREKIREPAVRGAFTSCINEDCEHIGSLTESTLSL